MIIEDEINKVIGKDQLSNIRELVDRDAAIYRKLLLFFAFLSVPLFFLFPVGLLVTIPLSFYFWYTYRKDSRARPVVRLVYIHRKECWFRDGKPAMGDTDTESVDTSFYYYLLKATVKCQWEVQKNQLVLGNVLNENLIVRLSQSEFEQFEEGKQVFLVFSPANDLIGYSNDSELVLLFRTMETEDGSIKKYSFSIPQELNYPPTGGFTLIE